MDELFEKNRLYQLARTELKRKGKLKVVDQTSLCTVYEVDPGEVILKAYEVMNNANQKGIDIFSNP